MPYVSESKPGFDIVQNGEGQIRRFVLIKASAIRR